MQEPDTAEFNDSDILIHFIRDPVSRKASAQRVIVNSRLQQEEAFF